MGNIQGYDRIPEASQTQHVPLSKIALSCISSDLI